MSGRIEFTWLIYKNFICLVGLLKLNSLGSLAPFREIFVERGTLSVALGVVVYLALIFFISIYSWFVSASSGLLSDPDSPFIPVSNSIRLFLSSFSILINGDDVYYLPLPFLLDPPNSKASWYLISCYNCRYKALINVDPSSLYSFGVNSIFLPSLK